MSNEIKLQPKMIEQGIADLRSSMEALETTFSKEIEGKNNLDMVSLFNEIKKDYDELLTQYSTLFLSNVQAADTAVVEFQESERMVANAIRLIK